MHACIIKCSRMILLWLHRLGHLPNPIPLLKFINVEIKTYNYLNKYIRCNTHTRSNPESSSSIFFFFWKKACCYVKKIRLGLSTRSLDEHNLQHMVSYMIMFFAEYVHSSATLKIFKTRTSFKETIFFLFICDFFTFFYNYHFLLCNHLKKTIEEHRWRKM